MFVIILIFVIGLAPAFISAVMTVRAERKAKSEGLNPDMLSNNRLQSLLDRDQDLHYIEGMGYMIGDITCDLNARSPYLRCAVNPMGPCDGCRAYTPKVFDRQY